MDRVILGQVCLIRALQFQYYRIFKKGNLSIWVTSIYRFTIKVNKRSLRLFMKKGEGPIEKLRLYNNEKVIPDFKIITIMKQAYCQELKVLK